MRAISSIVLARPNDLQIEKHPYRVTVYLADGELLKGEVFLGSCSAQHPGSEILLDLVNDPDRTFLPFRERHRNGVHSLNRSAIVMLETKDPDMVGLDGPAAGSEPHFAPVVLKCLTWSKEPFVLRGLLYLKDQPPGRRRTADVLNSSDPFVVLRLEQGSYGLVNKTRIGFAFDG